MKQELRIGNMIFDDLNEVAKVCNVRGGAHRNIEVYENFKNETGWITVCEPRPIPITEDWLNRIYWRGYKDLYFNSYFCLDVSGHLYYHADYTGINIKFVHQLQNLYYALTGEELTISEPTKP